MKSTNDNTEYIRVLQFRLEELTNQIAELQNEQLRVAESLLEAAKTIETI